MKNPPVRFRSMGWFGLLVALCAPLAIRAGELLPFDAKSPAAIREVHAGKPFILAFWSITCAPCKEEMGVLAALHRQYPGVPIVLVATDPPSAKPAVIRLLAGQRLGQIETWAFADEFAERVRFAVDPHWSGELPRTYFFDAEHRVDAQSGLLDPAWVESWYTTVAKAKPKPRAGSSSGNAVTPRR